MADPFLDPAGDDPKLLAQVVDYYHRTLTSSSEAIDNLQSRGVRHSQAISYFRIGHADRNHVDCVDRLGQGYGMGTEWLEIDALQPTMCLRVLSQPSMLALHPAVPR